MNIDFSRNLIKGKIAEAIFEEMFRTSEEFTIIPIGYEHTVPELAQYQHHFVIKKVIENIRSAPDFALISKDKKNVFLVEVKYRHNLEPEEVLKIAEKELLTWNPSWLFIASTNGFYFDSCNNIIDHQGKIIKLSETWIKPETQNKFFSLLQEFIH